MTKKTSEEAIPVEETKTPTLNTIRSFIKSIFIILLSFVCVLIGVFIYQENVPVPEIKSSLVRTQPLKKLSSKRTPAVPALQQPISNPIKIDFLQHTTTTPKASPQFSTAEPKNPSLPLEDTIHLDSIPSVSTEADPIIQKEEHKAEIKNIQLADLFLLRDHLKNGETCLTDFKKLLAQHHTHLISENLLQDLIPICSHPESSFISISKTFSQEKKEALTTYYRLNNPAWLAYLKSFGTRLVDIRRLNPKKQRPKDLLSLIQNALNEKDIQNALELAQKLPLEMKESLNTFISEATAYTTAQKAVDDSILQFKGKGE